MRFVTSSGKPASRLTSRSMVDQATFEGKVEAAMIQSERTLVNHFGGRTQTIGSGARWCRKHFHRVRSRGPLKGLPGNAIGGIPPALWNALRKERAAEIRRTLVLKKHSVNTPSRLRFRRRRVTIFNPENASDRRLRQMRSGPVPAAALSLLGDHSPLAGSARRWRD